ncbi:MAG: MFS transporter [Actinomycetota bacterium]|jgi:EmrB/QacA subfamily drug resistance transporter|nr:MFS transporter [Actinomycetota bacterium]
MSSKKSSHRHAPDWLILSIACVAQFMVVLDVSVVNVALPHMGHDLHLSQNQAQWIINAYVLTFAGFLLLGGRAADLFGRRKVYLLGIGVFTLASVAAGFAATGPQMIAARAIQGLGGAILSPATLTIIVTTFHGPRLPKAIGAWSAVAGAGGAVGGLAGGLLTGWANWRWVFFINIPFGIAAAVAAGLYLQEKRNRDATVKLDVTGAILVTAGLTALIYGVVNTTTSSWTSTSTFSWLSAATVILIGFVVWEARVASHPLVPFRIFHSRPLSVANIVMLLAGGAFFAMWYFLTYYFQNILGYGAVRAGFAFLPMAIGIIVGAQLSSRLLVKVGVRPLLLVGAALATFGFLWLSRITPLSSYWKDVLAPAFLCSFAMGLLFAPLATAATAKVDRADAGLASGILNTARQVGGSLSLAVLGTVAYDRTQSYLHSAPSGAHPTLHFTKMAFVSGYSRAFEISGAITFVAFLVSLSLPAKVGHHSSHAPTVDPAAAAAGSGH